MERKSRPLGLGTLTATSPDGRPILYYGGVIHAVLMDKPAAFGALAEALSTGVGALQQYKELELLGGASAETCGCFELDRPGEVHLMWRIACVPTKPLSGGRRNT
jgi:hypothetical protein